MLKVEYHLEKMSDLDMYYYSGPTLHMISLVMVLLYMHFNYYKVLLLIEISIFFSLQKEAKHTLQG